MRFFWMHKVVSDRFSGFFLPHHLLFPTEPESPFISPKPTSPLFMFCFYFLRYPALFDTYAGLPCFWFFQVDGVIIPLLSY